MINVEWKLPFKNKFPKQINKFFLYYFMISKYYLLVRYVMLYLFFQNLIKKITLVIKDYNKSLLIIVKSNIYTIYCMI